MKRTYALLGAMLLLLATAPVGCADDERADDDDDDDDDSSGATTAVGGAGGSSSGSAGSGNNPGGSGGGSGDEKLYPLEVGYQWTYAVQPVGGGAVCGAGQHSTTVLGSAALSGKTAFELTNWCTGVSGTEHYAPGDGDELFLYYNGQWLTVIDPLLQEGHSWSYFNTSYTWHQETSVTVPAGTYSDCWTANQNVSYAAYTTYCRGVGMVRSYSQDLAGAGWDAQLQSKNW